MEENKENKENKTEEKFNWEKYENCRKRGPRRKGTLYVGMWLLFLGVFFLAINFGVFTYTDFGKIWPVFLLIPGIIFIMRGLAQSD